MIQGEWERQRVGEAARAHYTRARGEELELEGESNSYSDNGETDSPRACVRALNPANCGCHSHPDITGYTP